MSAVPLVVSGDRDPLVVKVRERLNIPGGDMLDAPLVEVLRGVQRARGCAAHGMIDEEILEALSLSSW